MHTIHDHNLISDAARVPSRQAWGAPFLVSLVGWIAGTAMAVSVGGWMGVTIGAAAWIGVPALWLFGEILFEQD